MLFYVGGSTNVTIGGGNYYSINERCINCDGQSNLTITKGVFNSNKTNDIYSGIIQSGTSGNIIIGNLNGSNEDLQINSNENKKMCGIWTYRIWSR